MVEQVKMETKIELNFFEIYFFRVFVHFFHFLKVVA